MTAPTDAERAEKIANARCGAQNHTSATPCLLRDAISAALAAVRAEERERCARIAEDKASIGIMRSMEATHKAEYALEIAAAIRKVSS